MVMRPELWGRGAGRASLAADPAAPRLVVPTPGRPAVHPGHGAASWPAEPRLVFACGRYEGIDQRVVDDAARADAGRRGLHRRLRAGRRRGGGARDRRGGRPAAARRARQPGVAGRGLASPTGCSRARSTPGPSLARPARSPRCCAAATTGRSPAGAGTRRWGAPRRDGPTCSRPCPTAALDAADRRAARGTSRTTAEFHPAAHRLALWTSTAARRLSVGPAAGAGSPRMRAAPPHDRDPTRTDPAMNTLDALDAQTRCAPTSPPSGRATRSRCTSRSSRAAGRASRSSRAW